MIAELDWRTSSGSAGRERGVARNCTRDALSGSWNRHRRIIFMKENAQ
jgi:hypothetical protein